MEHQAQGERMRNVCGPHQAAPQRTPRNRAKQTEHGRLTILTTSQVTCRGLHSCGREAVQREVA